MSQDPSFAATLYHQKRKVKKYLRSTNPTDHNKLVMAMIVVAALELCAEYNCENLVLSRLEAPVKTQELEP